MSVLIRGMEMPQCCRDCACYHHRFDDGYYDFEICGASGTVFNDGYSSVTGHKTHIDPFKVRLDNCPLVPVPPHYDLIDHNALKIAVMDCDAETRIDFLKHAMDCINKAPVVIPSDMPFFEAEEGLT